jgi:hypothetical protein
MLGVKVGLKGEKKGGRIGRKYNREDKKIR